MRLPWSRRPAAEPPSPAVVEAMQDLVLRLHTGLPALERLVAAHEAGGLDEAEREEARSRAAGLAAVGRLGHLLLLPLAEEVPETFAPWAGLRVAGQLTFCFTELAHEDPGSLAVLGRDELAGLLERQGADAWLAQMRELLDLEDPC